MSLEMSLGFGPRSGCLGEEGGGWTILRLAWQPDVGAHGIAADPTCGTLRHQVATNGAGTKRPSISWKGQLLRRGRTCYGASRYSSFKSVARLSRDTFQIGVSQVRTQAISTTIVTVAYASGSIDDVPTSSESIA
jgi:hypothetical protein